MEKRLQFRLRSIFWLTAIVAVNCLVMPPAITAVRDLLTTNKQPAVRCCGVISYGEVCISIDNEPDWSVTFPDAEVQETPMPPQPKWESLNLTFVDDDGSVIVQSIDDSLPNSRALP